jgi:PhnB protein
MSVQNPPPGYHSVTPYLTVDDANGAIDFYKRAFGAVEIMRLPMGGKIGHAEIKVGDSHIMLSDEWPDMGVLGPKTRGGPTASLMVYLSDVDSAFARAVREGARADKGVEDQFWGDRMGTVTDPFGHKWTLATHVEDVPEDEMKKRMEQFSAQACEVG